jgi:collagenase-like PrtC family protease
MLLEGSRINKRVVDAALSRGIHLLALPDSQSAAAVQALIDAGVDGVILTDPALIAGLR